MEKRIGLSIVFASLIRHRVSHYCTNVLVLLPCVLFLNSALAQTPQHQLKDVLLDRECVQRLTVSDIAVTGAYLLEHCQREQSIEHNERSDNEPSDPWPFIAPVELNDQAHTKSLLANRLWLESIAERNPQAITPHRLNYLIPISYNSARDPMIDDFYLGPINRDLTIRPIEAKFQFSFKAPIVTLSRTYNSKVYFGFTALSFWQVYTKSESSPFRETNYEPEVFWHIPFKLNFLDTEINVAKIGFSHQSNGRDVPFSRSWNRIYASLNWEFGDWVFEFKPWYRLPETLKTDPDATEGDDNPDIEKYLGHFEVRTFLKNHRNAVAIMVRNNLRSDNKGALQLDWNFPLNYPLKPYVQFFVGYGESLIDYNKLSRRVSLGILLGEWL